MNVSSYQCPPGLLLASVLYWGWQVELWSLALIIGGILEVARWVPWRLQLNTRHFKHIADATAVVFFIAGVVFFTSRLHEGLFFLMQWLPLILSVLLAAQLYSEARLLPLEAIVASLRKKRRESSSAPLPKIDLQLPYVFISVLAASIAAPPTKQFYLTLCVLLGWALWGLRPKQHHRVVWSLLLLSALSFGFLIHNGISQLQGNVQEWTSGWFEGDWSNRDVFKNSTRIGQLGKLKLSERIVMRVRSNEGADKLLQQGVYNRYFGGTWLVNDKNFIALEKQLNTNRWLLSDYAPQTGGVLEISADLRTGEGILALPLNAYAIESPEGSSLARNINGAIQITGGKEKLTYRALFHQDHRKTQTPVKHDLEVPDVYHKVMNEIVNELNLVGLSPIQAAHRIKQYFTEYFQYSLIQDESDIITSPLTYFLREGKQGHCEYFATAGTLLLRVAGIPARYTTGFLMGEYDPDSGLFVVRKRHAHAWTIAYINGQWREFDYTPANWAQLESDTAPWWKGIYDALSHLGFVSYQWWERKPTALFKYVLGGLVSILVLAIVVKRKRKGITLQWRKSVTSQSNVNEVGSDSPFKKIIEALESKAVPRNKGETLKQWLNRLHDTIGLDLTELNPIVEAHYRYRFSSDKVNDARNSALDKRKLKRQLARQVEEWLNSKSI